MPGDGSKNKYLPYSLMNSIIAASVWPNDGSKEGKANSVLLNHKKSKIKNKRSGINISQILKEKKIFAKMSGG